MKQLAPWITILIIAVTPWIILYVFGQECQDTSPGICGAEGPMGCSGDPNPPTDVDIWKYKHGEFTPRQGDIMLESCYSPENMAIKNADPKDVTITLNMSNGTMISLFGNGTIIPN